MCFKIAQYRLQKRYFHIVIVKGVLNDEIQLVGPFFIKVKINLNSLKNKVLPFTKWMGRPPIQIFINRKGILLS